MKKYLHFCLSIFLITLFFTAQTNAITIQTTEKPEENLVKISDGNETEYYAVIVGIEEYKGFDTPTQEYLDETATAFYETLLQSDNWKEENIKFLLNENATKENIHDAITVWLADKENEDDIVVIYHAGHGWKTKLKNRMYGNAYILTYNSSGIGYGPDKITDKEYDSWLDELDSKNIAVILENCYSGRWIGLRQSGRIILAAGGKYLLCPCNWSIYLEDSIFGFFFRQALDGVADINNDGWVTVKEAYYYLRIPVIWHSAFYHFPYIWDTFRGKRFVGPQVPYLYDRHIGDIPLVKV